MRLPWSLALLAAALMRAARGTAAGALTSPNQVDLGKPVWQ